MPISDTQGYQFGLFVHETDDVITTFGSAGGADLDETIVRHSTVYDSKRNLTLSVSSYHSASGGTVLNQVGYLYNDFGQATADRQEHGGAVDGSTPQVGYVFADGSRANTNRLEGVILPDGRQIDVGYGPETGADDRLGRVEFLKVVGEASEFVRYGYLGADTTVDVIYPACGADGVNLSLRRQSSSDPVGDAGDPYTGLDRFGQIIDMPWRTGAVTPVTLDHYQWGYDRIGNRNWKTNLVAEANAPTLPQDEKYNYDGLSQIEQFVRGRLNLNGTAIGGIPAAQENFAFDATGNWDRNKTAADGTTTLDQSRVNNRDNQWSDRIGSDIACCIAAARRAKSAMPRRLRQIAQIDGSSDTIAHDLAGNATKMPPGSGGDWDKHFRLKWDGWNRLVEVRDQDGVLVAQYRYDALTRRITRMVAGTTTHSYYNHEWRPVEERIGNSSTASEQYLWGARYRDDLVRRDRDTNSNGTLDEILYVTHDYFNPTAILAASDASVQERYAYSAFGVRRIMAADFSAKAAGDFDWDFAFQGQFEDGETGYLNYGYRYYLPETGRWLSRDPINDLTTPAFDNISTEKDLYAFVGNSPINSIDLWGLLGEGERPLTLRIFRARFLAWYNANNSEEGREWLSRLPQCPSKIEFCKITGEPLNCSDEYWKGVEPADPNYHPDAAWCFRSVSYFGHAQQCCFRDKGRDGELITEGLGAGTPDKAQAGIQKGLGLSHYFHDVLHFNRARQLDTLDTSVPEKFYTNKYFEVRPPSKGGGACQSPAR